MRTAQGVRSLMGSSSRPPVIGRRGPVVTAEQDYRTHSLTGQVRRISSEGRR